MAAPTPAPSRTYYIVISANHRAEDAEARRARWPWREGELSREPQTLEAPGEAGRDTCTKNRKLGQGKGHLWESYPPDGLYLGRVAYTWGGFPRPKAIDGVADGCRNARGNPPLGAADTAAVQLLRP